jgi:hypothetical protein
MTKKLKRIPLGSSMIEAAAYDSQSKTMYLQFVHTGYVYAYDRVPEATFRELLESGSVGRFVRDEILDFYTGYKVRSGRDFRW